MRRAALLVLCAIAAGGSIYAEPANAKSGDPIPGRYIVTLRSATDPVLVSRRHGVVADASYRYAIRGFAAALSKMQMDNLQKDPSVARVEPDRIVLLEKPVHVAGKPGSGTQPVQSVPTGIDRIDADQNSVAGINGQDRRVDVDVAVIDTGIQVGHPDLNVFQSRSFVSGRKGDDNGHGTHVAGTIAALDNGIGVVGVVPGARLWAVKVFDRNGSAPLSTIIQGIDYVAQNASSIEAANMSFGFFGSSFAFDLAVSNAVAAGVTMVAAAGNDSFDAVYYSPANHPDVITVSAIADFDGVGGGVGFPTCWLDDDDTLADFSNYGSVVSIAAPGVCILSTYKGGGYAWASGTSMAAPHVTGAAALYHATLAQLTPGARPSPAQVKAALLYNAKSQSNTTFGFSGDPDGSAEPMLYAAVMTPPP